MRVYVIIVTYNAERWLQSCLNSLITSTVPLDVVVVDNQSTDNTVAIIERDYGFVKLIKSDLNLGFGKGNNQGINYAMQSGADYVFLLNQDAYLQPDTVENLVKASERNPEYYIISPIHLSGNPTVPDSQFITYATPPNCRQLMVDYFADKDNLKDVYETKFVNAALWLLPKQCLIDIGGFDPIYPHYGEDNDFVNRVRFHGFKVGICPHAKATHDRNQPSATPAQAPSKLTAEKLYKRRYKEYLITLTNLGLADEDLRSRLLNRLPKKLFKLLTKLDFTGIVNEFKVLKVALSQLDIIKQHRAIARSGKAAFLKFDELVEHNEIRP